MLYGRIIEYFYRILLMGAGHIDGHSGQKQEVLVARSKRPILAYKRSLNEDQNIGGIVQRIEMNMENKEMINNNSGLSSGSKWTTVGPLQESKSVQLETGAVLTDRVLQTNRGVCNETHEHEKDNRGGHEDERQNKNPCFSKSRMLAYECNFQPSKKSLTLPSQKITPDPQPQPQPQPKIIQQPSVKPEPLKQVQKPSPPSTVKSRKKNHPDPIRKQLKRVYDL